MNKNEVGINLARLRAHLATVQPGKIADTTDLEPLLAACWDEFSGDYGGMEGSKLLGRMEGVTWEPPVVRFMVRHGRTVAGASWADLQGWTVNVEKQTIFCEPLGHR